MGHYDCETPGTSNAMQVRRGAINSFASDIKDRQQRQQSPLCIFRYQQRL